MKDVATIEALLARTRELEGQNHSRAALDIGREAQRCALELGRVDLVGKALLRQAFSHFNLSRQLDAVEAARASLPYLLEAGDAISEATALAVIALGLTGAGSLDEGAEALIGATIAVERVEGDSIDLVFALDCVSDAHATLGAFDLAVPLIERAVRIAETAKDATRLMWAYQARASLHWRYGESLSVSDPSESSAQLQIALASARRSGQVAEQLANPDMLALAELFEGLARVSLGDLDFGVAALESADRRGVGVDSPNETGLVALGLGRAFAERGHHELARRQLDRAVASFEGASFLESLSRALHERARCAITAGDTASAIADLECLVDLRDRQYIAQVQRRINTVEARIELRRAEEQHVALVELANRDALTGLFNRRGFDAAAASLAISMVDYAVLEIDIDGFKQINDTYSHLVGDRVLKELAETLQSQARASDTVCRYAGDEFVLLLPKTALAHAIMLAERIRSSVLSAAWEHAGVPLAVSISIGVAVGRGEVDAVFGVADRNLYRAKALGRNRVVGDASVLRAA